MRWSSKYSHLTKTVFTHVTYFVGCELWILGMARYIPATCLFSIFEIQPSKRRRSIIKTRVIWAPNIYFLLKRHKYKITIPIPIRPFDTVLLAKSVSKSLLLSNFDLYKWWTKLCAWLLCNPHFHVAVCRGKWISSWRTDGPKQTRQSFTLADSAGSVVRHLSSRKIWKNDLSISKSSCKKLLNICYKNKLQKHTNHVKWDINFKIDNDIYHGFHHFPLQSSAKLFHPIHLAVFSHPPWLFFVEERGYEIRLHNSKIPK